MQYQFSKSNVSICPSRFHTYHFKVTDETKILHDWTGMLESSPAITRMENKPRCFPEPRRILIYSVRGNQFLNRTVSPPTSRDAIVWVVAGRKNFSCDNDHLPHELLVPIAYTVEHNEGRDL